MRLLHGTNIDFISMRTPAAVFSVLAVLATVGLLATRGLNLGVDFAGGTEIQVKFDRPVGAETVREIMADIGFAKASVQEFGAVEDNEYLIRVERMSLLSDLEHKQISAAIVEKYGDEVLVEPYDPNRADSIEVTIDQAIEESVFKEIVEAAGLVVDQVRSVHRDETYQYSVVLEGVSTRLAAQLDEKVGEGAADMRRVEYVGPQVGEELRTRGYISLLYAGFFILIYLAIRFDFRFAPGAVIALAHDAFLTVGMYSLTGIEFNLTSIAAILTIIGYSVNDTVVVYDRIRENTARYSGRSLADLINQSVNETLNRTIITSGTTMMALLGLWFYAQGTIWDFAVAMTFGIVVGTYSTMFIASPMVLFLEGLFSKQRGRAGGDSTSSGGKASGSSEKAA